MTAAANDSHPEQACWTQMYDTPPDAEEILVYVEEAVVAAQPDFPER